MLCVGCLQCGMGWNKMGSGAAGQDRELHPGEIQHLRRVRYSGLAGQRAADSHIWTVNVIQWKRKCLEKPESIACSLLSLMLSVCLSLERG